MRPPTTQDEANRTQTHRVMTCDRFPTILTVCENSRFLGKCSYFFEEQPSDVDRKVSGKKITSHSTKDEANRT